MKKLLFILFLLIRFANAQSICVAADCKDSIFYPATSVSLNGRATSVDTIKSVSWKVTSGTSAIANINVDTTSATLNIGGIYVYLFTATSNKGAVGTAFDTVIYIANKPPTAITGNPITTSVSTATLSGSNSVDPEGLPLTYLWAEASGPSATTINTATMANPVVSGLINGVYSFKLTVTDSGGLISSSTQAVSVSIPVVTVIKVTTTVYKSDGSSTTTQIYP